MYQRYTNVIRVVHVFFGEGVGLKNFKTTAGRCRKGSTPRLFFEKNIIPRETGHGSQHSCYAPSIMPRISQRSRATAAANGAQGHKILKKSRLLQINFISLHGIIFKKLCPYAPKYDYIHILSHIIVGAQVGA